MTPWRAGCSETGTSGSVSGLGKRARGKPVHRAPGRLSITDADVAWVRAHHDGPALLHRVDPRLGLTADDFTRLAHWAAALG